MSPILVRPVREQFEHDRVIRVLQAKYKRKYEVAINPGSEQNAAIGVGDLPMYPDLVLFSPERNRKIQGTVEVETSESINTLEAQAEWGPFSKQRAPFFLYVPANSIDTVRRLCSEHGIDPAEIWTYHTALDQVRFTLVHRSPDAPKGTIPELKPKPPVPLAPEPAEETVALTHTAKMAIRTAAAIPPSAKPGATKAGADRTAAAKAGPAKNGAAKNGPAKNGAAKNGAAKNGAAKNGAAKNGSAKAPRNNAAPVRPAKAPKVGGKPVKTAAKPAKAAKKVARPAAKAKKAVKKSKSRR